MNETARMPLSNPPPGDAGDSVRRERARTVTWQAAAPFGKTVALALLTGIATYLWSPALASQPWLWSALLIGALLWWRGRAVRWIGALAFGFALAGLHAAHALSLQLPVDREKREVTVQGRVV